MNPSPLRRWVAGGWESISLMRVTCSRARGTTTSIDDPIPSLSNQGVADKIGKRRRLQRRVEQSVSAPPPPTLSPSPSSMSIALISQGLTRSQLWKTHPLTQVLARAKHLLQRQTILATSRLIASFSCRRSEPSSTTTARSVLRRCASVDSARETRMVYVSALQP